MTGGRSTDRDAKRHRDRHPATHETTRHRDFRIRFACARTAFLQFMRAILDFACDSSFNPQQHASTCMQHGHARVIVNAAAACTARSSHQARVVMVEIESRMLYHNASGARPIAHKKAMRVAALAARHALNGAQCDAAAGCTCSDLTHALSLIASPPACPAARRPPPIYTSS
jgi:hypothetical protein